MLWSHGRAEVKAAAGEARGQSQALHPGSLPWRSHGRGQGCGTGRESRGGGWTAGQALGEGRRHLLSREEAGICLEMHIECKCYVRWALQ